MHIALQLMTITIIIILCTLLLIAYVFDLTSKKTRIPSVLMLLLLGWIAGRITEAVKFPVPDLSRVLPVLGVVGLILIVLDGSLELEFNRTKMQIIKKSFMVAVIPMIVISSILMMAFHYFLGASLKDGLANAIPFSVISSAIAITSAKNLRGNHREFITYESSFSDIIGVLFFNFIVLNNVIDAQSILTFFLQLLLIAIVSFVASAALAFLLSKIEHQIKFAPIVLSVILIYAISEVYHLPALVFILLFGLFLGNLDELKGFTIISRLRPTLLNNEVHKLKEIIAEGTFLVRSLFFLLFGFLMETADILNTSTLVWAVSIVALIFIVRAFQLKISRLPMRPLLFMAPRGLVNVLLFLAISPGQQIPFVNTALMIQVIILASLVLMLGLMASRDGLTESE